MLKMQTNSPLSRSKVSNTEKKLFSLSLHLFLYLCSEIQKSMKKKALTLLIIATIFMVGCQRSSMSEQLTQIDSLLVNDQVDSALTCLKNISLENLETEADSAYYYILMAESRYRLKGPDVSDSSTNYSINYYKNTSDNEKLIRSYYYKGVNTYNSTKPQKAILLIKQAEELANKTNNLLLQHKIYETLSHYNSISYESEVALAYAKKAYQTARELNDKERQAIALIYMAGNYSHLGNKDSLAICVNECLPLADYLTEIEKAYLYTRMGELYESSDSEIAKKYLLKAIDIHPQVYTYRALSNIYIKEGDTGKARDMWERSLQTSGSIPAKIGIYKAMRLQSINQKNYQQANALADSIILRQQNYYETKEQEKIAEIQAKYDKEAAERDIKEQVMGWGLVLLVVVVVIISWLSYRSYKGMRAKKELAETKVQLEAYTRKAEELEKSDKTNTREIGELHKKINELLHRHTGILAKGKELFDAIEAGGTTVRWSKDDFINYLEYYKLKDLPFVNEMETEYNHLSPKYIFFAVLEHEGYDEEDIQHIMGISESTLRSTRSRINSKRL